jgi:hypothetical protein
LSVAGAPVVSARTATSSDAVFALILIFVCVSETEIVDVSSAEDISLVRESVPVVNEDAGESNEELAATAPPALV